jgi:hypothetical protein
MCSHLLLLALVVVPDPSAMGPIYQVETRGSNSVVAQAEKGRTVFVVTSERGIGWADIKQTKGEWPENVTLRFRLSEGKGFTALEGITVRTDQLVVAGAIKVTDLDKEEVTIRMKFAFVDANGKPDSSQLDGKNEAGTLNIQVKRREGGLELVLPARMLRGSSKMSLGWTDWYR